MVCAPGKLQACCDVSTSGCALCAEAEMHPARASDVVSESTRGIVSWILRPDLQPGSLYESGVLRGSAR